MNSSNNNFEKAVLNNNKEVEIGGIISNPNKAIQQVNEISKNNPPKLLIKKNRFVAVIFASITVFIGLITLLRGIFLTNPPYFNNSDLVKSLNHAFNLNNPTEISNVNLNLNNVSLNLFGSSIKTPFTYDYSDQKIWITRSLSDKVIVGFIDSLNNYNLKYTLPANSNVVNLYEDESISYVVNQLNTIPRFYSQQIDKDPIEVASLNIGEYFISTYYQPQEKSFYYSSFDSNNNLYIRGVNLDGKVFNIFSSSYLNNQTKIIFIDRINNIFYLQNNLNCFSLTLVDKNLKNYNCQNIKRNNEDKLYWSNYNTTGIYNSIYAGEIYQNSSQDLSRKVIFTGGVGEIFNNLSYHNNNLYFVSYQLKQISANVWTPEAKSINKLDLLTFQKTLITNNLPIIDVVSLVPQGDSLLAIVGAGHILQKYSLTPYSYPGTLIAQPLSYSSSSQYWSNNFLIDPNASVEILSGKYTLN